MLLSANDLVNHYNTKVNPFVRNGIIIDTSVLDEIIKGIIETRISKRKFPEFQYILDFLDLLKISNKWDKFYITPHILTEVCTHLRIDYEKKWKKGFSQIVEEILPILKEMNETQAIIKKNNILDYIDMKQPVVEVGDISIYLTADNYIGRKEKIAILAKDGGINDKYVDHPYVMVMDYRQVIYNLL